VGLELMPGDAVSYLIGPDAMASMDPERLNELRDSLGLNDPFLLRYFSWLVGVLQGDFGYSLTSGNAVADIVARRLPATLELAVAALVVSTIAGTILGLISALRKGTTTDNTLTFLGMAGLSIPEFFFGLVLIVVFGIKLDWLPSGGR